MNDRSLADLLAALDAELARHHETRALARDVLDRVEARAPGAIHQAAARLTLRSLGLPEAPVGHA